jgi:DNA polymerase-3 subunit beta
MKFNVSSVELLDRLALTSKVMSSKPVVEVLNNILFEVKDGKLTIMGTDLQTTLVSELALSDVAEEGSVAVSRKIMDPLQNMPQQSLTVSTDDKAMLLTVTCSTGKYSFPYCDSDEFPMIPADEGTTKLAIPAAIVSDGIGSTSFAVGNDDMRPVMNGICFDFHEDNLVFVGTDGSRLIRYTRKDVAPAIESTMILPKKTASVLKLLLARESGDAQLSFNDKSASFSLADYRIVSRLIEGKYPAYNSVIPTDDAVPNKSSINRADLLSALKRVSTMSPPETLLVKLIFSDSGVNVTAQDTGYSLEGEEHLECRYEGSELTIGFKAKFLVEMLELLHSTEVSIKMSQPGKAGLIVPSEELNAEIETIMLLMPMHLGDNYR